MPASIRIIVQPTRARDCSRASGLAAVAVLLGVLLIMGCKQTSPAAVAASSSSKPTPVVNSIGMLLMPIAPGEFVMGSPVDEPGHDPDETQHKVRITKPFLLGVYQVTQSQYAAVMGNNPSYFKGEDFPEAKRGDLPVDSVSWDEAVEFCKRLSKKEGKTYRLPTEAEREYACRAGSTGPYAGYAQLDDIGWYLINSDDTTHPVGMLQPNDWGLYDMQGNLWEWCSDWYGKYPPGDATDPTGPAHGTMRVLRGGAIGYDQEYARAAFRNSYVPDSKVYHNGFRVAVDSR